MNAMKSAWWGGKKKKGKKMTVPLGRSLSKKVKKGRPPLFEFPKERGDVKKKHSFAFGKQRKKKTRVLGISVSQAKEGGWGKEGRIVCIFARSGGNGFIGRGGEEKRKEMKPHLGMGKKGGIYINPAVGKKV